MRFIVESTFSRRFTSMELETIMLDRLELDLLIESEKHLLIQDVSSTKKNVVVTILESNEYTLEELSKDIKYLIDDDICSSVVKIEKLS